MSLLALSIPQMRALLSAYELNYGFEVEEDGRYAGSIEEIDLIVADGSCLEELRMNLALHLIAYAKDFMSNFHHYASAPNTKKHVPYVLRILIEDSMDAVVSMLHGDAEME